MYISEMFGQVCNKSDILASLIVTTWDMQAVKRQVVDKFLINLLQVVRFLPAYVANAVSQAYQLANCRIAKHHGSLRFLNHC